MHGCQARCGGRVDRLLHPLDQTPRSGAPVCAPSPEWVPNRSGRLGCVAGPLMAHMATEGCTPRRIVVRSTKGADFRSWSYPRLLDRDPGPREPIKENL